MPTNLFFKNPSSLRNCTVFRKFSGYEIRQILAFCCLYPNRNNKTSWKVLKNNTSNYDLFPAFLLPHFRDLTVDQLSRSN